MNQRAMLIAVMVAVVASPLYSEMSWWIGAGLLAVTYVAVNIERQLRSEPIPLASLMFLFGGVQLIVAPWLTQYFPDDNPANQIPAAAIDAYMAYAVPLSLALGLGLSLARRLFPVANGGSRQPMPLFIELDRLSEKTVIALFWATFAVQVVTPSLPVPAVLAFFLHLLGQASLVFPLMLLLAWRRYWWKLAAVALGWQFVISVGATSFHSLILWAAFYATLYWAIRYRGRGFTSLLLAGALFVVVLQPAKTYFRVQGGGVSGFATVLFDYLSDPSRAYAPEVLSQTLMRVNQGWIVYRVMTWVPDQVPYAGWSIMARQVAGVLLPRMLLPDKYSVGGDEYFERYTGHRLYGGTSMGLGYAGEFYAAFGAFGGILAGGVYGFLFGLAFQRLRRAARSNPLWWAWGPLIFMVAVKAEDEVGNAVNWAVKSFVVVLMFRYLYRRLFLSWSERRRRAMVEAAHALSRRELR